MVSSKGVIGTSYLASTPMSYLRLWPILRMPGSTSTGRRRSSTSAIGQLARLRLVEIVDMAERHVDALGRPRRRATARPAGRGRHSSEVVSVVEGEQARGRACVEQALELCHVVDCPVVRRVATRRARGLGPVGRRCVGDLLDPLDQRLEIVVLEEGEQRGAVDMPAHGAVERDRQGRVVSQRHQVAATGAPARRTRSAICRRFGCLMVSALARSASSDAELLQQLGGGLDTDARARPARCRSCRRRAPGRPGPAPGRRRSARSTSAGSISLGLHRVPHRRRPAPTSCIRSLSEETMITSRSSRARPSSVGGDQVVRLEALDLDRRQAEGAGRVAHQRELRHQLGRWLVAIGLVLVVDLVAEADPAGVEDDDHVVVGMVLHQPEQHRGRSRRRR